MKDNIKPDHYRTGEIDLYEAWYRTYPFNEYRAIMQAVAERYMRRDKNDRVEDINKAIYTLERLKEKEILHAGRQVKIETEEQDNESVWLLESLSKLGFNYLARDCDGDLWMYPSRPIKKNTTWWESTVGEINAERLNNHFFPEVQWTDDKSTKVSDLLASYENGGENGR